MRSHGHLQPLLLPSSDNAEGTPSCSHASVNALFLRALTRACPSTWSRRISRTYRASQRTDVICLFDVDGTLSEPRKKAIPETLEFMAKLRERVLIGVVGGSDLVKQQEQLGADCLDRFDFFFSENGLAAYKQGELLKKTSFLEHLGNDRLKLLTNFILRYIADLDIPVKRGTFVEFRNGMLNVSPIGCATVSKAC